MVKSGAFSSDQQLCFVFNIHLKMPVFRKRRQSKSTITKFTRYRGIGTFPVNQ